MNPVIKESRVEFHARWKIGFNNRSYPVTHNLLFLWGFLCVTVLVSATITEALLQLSTSSPISDLLDVVPAACKTCHRPPSAATSLQVAGCLYCPRFPTHTHTRSLVALFCTVRDSCAMNCDCKTRENCITDMVYLKSGDSEDRHG